MGCKLVEHLCELPTVSVHEAVSFGVDRICGLKAATGGKALLCSVAVIGRSMPVAEDPGKPPLFVGAKHPHHRELGLAGERLFAVHSVPLEEEMLASLERTPARNWIDVEAARHELSPGAPGSWVLPFGAILGKDRDRSLAFRALKPPLSW